MSKETWETLCGGNVLSTGETRVVACMRAMQAKHLVGTNAKSFIAWLTGDIDRYCDITVRRVTTEQSPEAVVLEDIKRRLAKYDEEWK